MDKIRQVKKIFAAYATRDGAGVRLRRVFGYHQVPLFDPFLLLDEFRSEDHEDYMAGFPWHPHRGIETVTYVLKGSITHSDSLGNKGTTTEGECQWMTAGNGIIHMEMPKKSDLMWGYQLWVNLPAEEKRIDPKYRDIQSGSIPMVSLDGFGNVKILCGEYNGQIGPVTGISVSPSFLDIELEPDREFVYSTDPEHNVFAYLIEGTGNMSPESHVFVEKGHVVLFDKGDKTIIKSGLKGLRLLLFSGMPLNEPIAWGGPIVMNTQAELREAFEAYEKGEFVKGP